MDPFVVIAIDEFHKLGEESSPCITPSSSVSSLEPLQGEPTTRMEPTPLVPKAVPAPAPAPVPAPKAEEMLRTPLPPKEPPKNIAFAYPYPSPVLAFIHSKRQYVLIIFLVGIVTFRHKQLRKMLPH